MDYIQIASVTNILYLFYSILFIVAFIVLIQFLLLHERNHYYKAETVKTALAIRTPYTRFNMPFMSSTQETEWALFLQPGAHTGQVACDKDNTNWQHFRYWMQPA